MIIDPRLTQLADGLTGFSTALKKGERVLIDAFDVPEAMVIALVRSARSRGAMPYVQLHRARIAREMAIGAEEAQYETLCEIELGRMQKMNAYIALRGSENIFEASDVPSSRVQLVSRIMRPVIDHRVNKTRWVVLRWPSPAMAQQASMSTEAFEDFYFRVCTLDYARMKPGMKALGDLMRATDKVHIKGPGTDLRFSIKGIGAKECGGQYNIPDGEVFSCPVKDSVEGVVQYNAPTVYLGSSFDNIRLVFKKGKIVEATGSNTKRLNQILDSDAGARYVGRPRAHARHPVRREDRRIVPLHAGPGLRGLRQREQVPGPLGHGLHPEGGPRRRRDLVRREADPQGRHLRPEAAPQAEPGVSARRLGSHCGRIQFRRFPNERRLPRNAGRLHPGAP
jgi:aminopeptidase